MDRLVDENVVECYQPYSLPKKIQLLRVPYVLNVLLPSSLHGLLHIRAPSHPLQCGFRPDKSNDVSDIVGG